MNEHVKDYFSEFDPDAEVGHFHRVIALHEAPELSWEAVKGVDPHLPKGWFELSRLSPEDRLEFLLGHWLEALPFDRQLHQGIAKFFEGLEGIGIYTVQDLPEEEYHSYIVYSQKEERGFYKGATPASESALAGVEALFLPAVFPQEYVALLRLHNGFSKSVDPTGLLPIEQVPMVYQQLQVFLANKAPLETISGFMVDPATLIPFYESFGHPVFQCFSTDWYPIQEMGTVNYAGDVHKVSNFCLGELCETQQTFPTFSGWLTFYLESLVYSLEVEILKIVMYTVANLYRQQGHKIGLELVAGEEGLERQIRVPEVQRPGLGLSGYLKNYARKRFLVFGKVEMEYLRDLPADLCLKRLDAILLPQTPAVVVGRGLRPAKELQQLCEKGQIPLFVSPLPTVELLSKLAALLTEEFALSVSCHGTLVEVFGVGLLIQGDSSVGKSEAALGLLERGHRLVSDDIVRVTKREGGELIGRGAELTRHHMEIRGIGIINVANLYGAVCVRDHKSIEIVVKLEEWDDNTFYDRVGINEKYCDILGVKIPIQTLPVKPGRDVVLLLETIVLNHRLKGMGYHSAKEFNSKLLGMIASKPRGRITQVD